MFWHLSLIVSSLSLNWFKNSIYQKKKTFWALLNSSVEELQIYMQLCNFFIVFWMEIAWMLKIQHVFVRFVLHVCYVYPEPDPPVIYMGGEHLASY